MDYKELLKLKLNDQFKYKDYKNILQKEAIEAIYRGKNDIYICMPSGSGKSLCYQLPAITKNNTFAVVISPHILLIKNQIGDLKKKNIEAYSWHSFTPEKFKDDIKNYMTLDKMKMNLLYVTPDVFILPAFQGLLTQIDSDILAYIAIDEVHCLSKHSHDYRQSYKDIVPFLQKFSKVPIVAVTATASKRVQKDIFNILKLKNALKFIMPSFRSNLSYDVQFTDLLSDPILDLKTFIEQFIQLNDINNSQTSEDCGIIFCNKKDIKKLSESLDSVGLETESYDQKKMKDKLKAYQLWNSGKIKIILATSSFGIGIHKPTVRFVVHWGIPLSIGHFYQESGRAGHDGNLAYCRVYCNSKEMTESLNYINKEFLLLDYHNIYEVTKTISQGQIVKILTDTKCRHVAFSYHFEDKYVQCINYCDVCKDEKSVKEKVSSAFKHSTLCNTEKAQTEIMTSKEISSKFADDVKQLRISKKKMEHNAVHKVPKVSKLERRLKRKITVLEVYNAIVKKLYIEVD